MQWQFQNPYCLFVRTSVRRERYSVFKELAASVAYAYRQHSSRVPWSAYATVAGPSLQAFILVPLENLRDIDSVTSMERVMVDVYGDTGRQTMAQFQDCVLDMGVSVLNRISPESAPSPRTEPPQFLYYANLDVRPAYVSAFVESVGGGAVLDAQNPFTLFGTFAGQTRLHGFMAGNSLADLAAAEPIQRRFISGLASEGEAPVSMQHSDALLASETSSLSYIGHQGA